MPEQNPALEAVLEAADMFAARFALFIIMAKGVEPEEAKRMIEDLMKSLTTYSDARQAYLISLKPDADLLNAPLVS